jgi:hypothetical protein
MMKKIATLVALAFCIQCGCSMKKMTTRVIGDIGTDGMVAVESEQDIAFAQESIPSLIKTLEVLRYGDTRDRRTLVLLSKAYGTYVFAFLEEKLLALPDASPERKVALDRAELFYRRGKEYGMAALIQDRGMKKAFTSPYPEFKKFVSKLGKKSVHALFWTSFNWANWMNLNRDDPSAVVNLPRVQAMIDRVIELDPEYYYGSAHALKGVLAAARPEMLGGDLALANAEMTRAMSIAPGYLMTAVLYAQYYARQTNDAPLFRKTLDDVIAAQAAALPEQRLANELAQRRAHILLQKEKELF